MTQRDDLIVDTAQTVCDLNEAVRSCVLKSRMTDAADAASALKDAAIAYDVLENPGGDE